MNAASHHSRVCSHQRGATLIEVLVAIVVLAIGLLGTAALQTRAQQAELDSYQRSQALILAQDMVNRIRANWRAAGCYVTYETSEPPEPETGFVGGGATPDPCTGWGTAVTRERADEDLLEWTALLNGEMETLDGANVGAMTGARGCVEFDGTGDADLYIVHVAWQGQNPTQAPDNACAEGMYGDDDSLRRTVNLTLRLNELG